MAAQAGKRHAVIGRARRPLAGRTLPLKKCLISPSLPGALLFLFLFIFISSFHPSTSFSGHITTPPEDLTATVTILPLSNNHFYRPSARQNELLLNSSRKSPSFSTETDNIDPYRTSFTTISTQPTPSSESPLPGPLNFSIAPRRSSSSTNPLTTFDVTSFITDNHQQSWLPSPPPQQPTAQNNNSSNNNSNNNFPPEDFVLYPDPSPRDSCPAPPSATPRSSAYRFSPLVRPENYPRRSSLSLQQYLRQQQLAASPGQVPHQTRLVSQSTGYPLSSSHRSSPSNNQKHLLRLHAAAVASSNSTSARYQRPPVPLFNSPVNYSQKQHPTYHRRIMSTPNIAQDFPDLLDFTADHFGSDFDAMEPTMLSPHQIPTGIMASKDPLAGVPSGTISPKDLFMDASAPPSTSFTDMSTPSFESPGYFSQDTSPMFAAADGDLAAGSDQWDSLFPPDGMSFPVDASVLDIPTAPAPAPAATEPREQTPSASPMVRNSSQVGTPGSTRSTKHSTVAGVNARSRKPLPPITFDSSDPVAMKRARNTEAARKSRARKLERQGDMQRRIDELEKALEEAQQSQAYWKALAESRA